MAEVTAKLIQELREKTSAGMLDCKKALIENNGDIEAAADWLRQKGIVKAASKAGRVAASGLVTVVKCDNLGCVVELNAETDFVAKNEKFQALVANVANKALELNGDFDATLNAVKDDIAATISTIGENMNLRRVAKVSGDNVYSYIHNALVPGMGQIGVVVAINGNDPRIDEVGPKVAMHIAANKPEYMTVADVDPAAVERERKVFIESGATNGKPENIVEKMVEGRLNLYWKNNHLLWIQTKQLNKLSRPPVVNWLDSRSMFWAKVSKNAKTIWPMKLQKCCNNFVLKNIGKIAPMVLVRFFHENKDLL